MQTVPHRWRRLWGAAFALVIAVLVGACSPVAQNELAPQPPPESEAQEAMVDRQMFAPQFPTVTAGPPNLSSPLGDPSAPPLGVGAVLGD
ncbi:hypothetical protein NZK32_09305 [Cyanobium sp. FGCU-52]|nr:hypothetical protein [Cyanobium sp. FGCU52]